MQTFSKDVEQDSILQIMYSTNHYLKEKKVIGLIKDELSRRIIKKLLN